MSATGAAGRWIELVVSLERPSPSMPELEVQAVPPMQARKAVAMMDKRMKTRTQNRSVDADAPRKPAETRLLTENYQERLNPNLNH